MKTVSPNLKKILILFLLIISFSCEIEENIETKTVSTEILKTNFEIPAPKIQHNDSILRNILDKELHILKTGKQELRYQNRSMTIDKTNIKKVYVHYLPWFQTKEYDGYWGQHWTMSNKNPDNLDTNGNNEIASYYNPLVGPYASRDPYLQEYHFLLMKLSGIDGVIFDWYGSRDIHDYGLIKKATETFIPKLENINLDFSIMYEDRVAYMEEPGNKINPIKNAKQDFRYIRDTYLNNPNYIKFNDTKFISFFGPHYITKKEQWNSIYNVFKNNNKPEFISLWGLKESMGKHFTGEFLWVAPDHLLAQNYYYQTHADSNSMTIGSTYPGFKSFYAQGGWSDGVNEWELPMNDGDTFVEVLNNNAHEDSDFIQVITWNDFGEGTMIEPTTQHGFMFLEILQEYTGVSFTADDLAVVARLYKARKNHRDNPEIMGLLDSSYDYMKSLDISRVDGILQAIEVYY
jgi:hypothetical protein